MKHAMRAVSLSVRAPVRLSVLFRTRWEGLRNTLHGLIRRSVPADEPRGETRRWAVKLR